MPAVMSAVAFGEGGSFTRRRVPPGPYYSPVVSSVYSVPSVVPPAQHKHLSQRRRERRATSTMAPMVEICAGILAKQITTIRHASLRESHLRCKLRALRASARVSSPVVSSVYSVPSVVPPRVVSVDSLRSSPKGARMCT